MLWERLIHKSTLIVRNSSSSAPIFLHAKGLLTNPNYKSSYCRGWRCDNNMAVAKQQQLIIEYKMAQINGGINIITGCSAITMLSLRFSLISQTVVLTIVRIK